jgi:hypothetical protein
LNENVVKNVIGDNIPETKNIQPVKEHEQVDMKLPLETLSLQQQNNKQDDGVPYSKEAWYQEMIQSSTLPPKCYFNCETQHDVLSCPKGILSPFLIRFIYADFYRF